MNTAGSEPRFSESCGVLSLEKEVQACLGQSMKDLGLGVPDRPTQERKQGERKGLRRSDQIACVSSPLFHHFFLLSLRKLLETLYIVCGSKCPFYRFWKLCHYGLNLC